MDGNIATDLGRRWLIADVFCLCAGSPIIIAFSAAQQIRLGPHSEVKLLWPNRIPLSCYSDQDVRKFAKILLVFVHLISAVEFHTAY